MVLKKVIDAVGKIQVGREKDVYLSLLRSIIGQQLSIKAAQTIWKRFLELFPDEYPYPDKVIAIKTERLRGAGLSAQKAGYLRNIAAFALEDKLRQQHLESMSDEELINHLTQIKGVGRWTAEMVLMFTLGRQDVFPVDDLGIVQGIQKLYGIRTRTKKGLVKKMFAISDQWRPYRTLGCMYIWRSRDLKL